MNWELIFQYVFAGGVGVVLVELVKGWFGRGKNRADGEKSKAEAAALLSGDARQWALQASERADKAEKRASELLDKLDLMSDTIDELERRIARCLGGFPCPNHPLEIVTYERDK